jgi:aarF domain-containing kinase
LISSVFNAQVFLEGFVHCDPHPANVLIREKNGKPQMVLLDHGLYKQLDDDFRIRYALLWRSLMMADVQAIKEACRSLGVDEMVGATFEDKSMPLPCIISHVGVFI